MTNPYQSNESHPGTDEWASQQQQPQQQYQQPYYQQQYQPQQKSNTGLVVALSVLGTLVLLALAGAVAFLVVRSDGSKGEQQDPVIVTEIETVAPESQNGQNSQNNQGSKPNVNRREPMGSSVGFSNATAETGNTSSEFAGNVLAVFNERAAATGEFPGSLSVYSPVTGQTYAMSCWPAGGGARCQGGNNASVYLY